MESVATGDKTSKPNPTFFKAENSKASQKPIVTKTDKPSDPRPEPRGERLSRDEMAKLLAYYHDEQSRPLEPQPDPVRSGHQLVQRLAFAGSIALVLGFGAGLYSLASTGGETRLGKAFNAAVTAFVNGESVPTTATRVAVTSAKPAKVAVVRQSPAKSNKPIRTASIKVSDASGTLGAGIALKLVLPKGLDKKGLAIRITDVPADSVLTVGRQVANGVWQLAPHELANAAIVLSAARPGVLHLGVELVETTTGSLLTPTRIMRVAYKAPKLLKVGGL